MPRKNSYKYNRPSKPGKSKHRSGSDVHSQVSKSLGDDIKTVTEEYLSGNREAAIGKLAILLNQSNVNKIKPILKKSIHSYVKHFRKDFEGNVQIKNCVYQMFSDFNMANFVERAWQYQPYYIPSSQYSQIQTVQKNPVYVTKYDYAQPLYKLANSLEYNPRELKRFKAPLETVRNDVKFYLSQDENNVFAKLVNLRYRPNDLKAVKLHNKDKSEEEKQYTVYDNYLYNRSMSISMYVLLDGDANKAFPFMRYDNDPSPHTNVFVGNDKRKEVYGDVALKPHFHFQNEDDSLLCLRKFKGEDNKTKYKIGRCNAIDCAHLKKYLLDLDQMNEKEILKRVEQNLDFAMPFLYMKAKNKKVGHSLDNLFYNFLKNKTDEEINLLDDFSLWLTQSKEDDVYHKGGCFDKIIRMIDGVERISSLMDSSINYEQRKLYSQLEILVADSLINTFCNNNANYILQNQEPKFTIETDLYSCEK